MTNPLGAYATNPGSEKGHSLPRSGGVILPQLNLTTVATDNFNRPNGTIAGANNWLATTEGSCAIASHELEVGAASAARGNYRSDAYNANQFSQIAVGSVPLASGDYIGVSVRNQTNQDNYTAILLNNSGTYGVQIYRKVAGVFGAVAGAAITNVGIQPQGTTLRIVAEGNVITATISTDAQQFVASCIDTTFTTGTPGIEAFWGTGGTATMANWTGGNAATGPVGAATATDNFAHSNGALPAVSSNWVTMAYSPAVGATVDLQVVTNQIVDTTATVHSGDIRTDSFNSDHWSSSSEGTTAMNATGFNMPVIRAQSNGLAGYIGGLFQNASWRIYRLDSGGGGAGAGFSTNLAIAGCPGGDPAGTVYTLVGKGSRISLRVNGSEVLAVTDATYTGGKPGLMGFATASMGSWSGGNV